MPRPPAPKPPSRLERTKDTLPSPVGRGDFRLDNHLVSATVLGLAHGDRAGSLVHARTAATTHEMGPLSLRIAGRAFRFERVYTQQGDTVTVRLEAAPDANRGIGAQLRYSLTRGSQTIDVSLALTRSQRSHAWRGPVAIHLHPGLARAFVPGHGYTSLPASSNVVEFHAPGSSYALTSFSQWKLPKWTLQRAPEGQLESSRVISLAPGGSVRLQIALVLGGRGWSAALRPLLTARSGDVPARLSVVDERGEPLPHARIGAWHQRQLEAVAMTGQDGRVTLPLPPGKYRLRAIGKGRAVSGSLSLPSGGSSTMLRTSAPSQLVFDTRQVAERTEPVQLKIVAQGKDAGGLLLGRAPLAGLATWISPLGRGLLPLPPGNYRVQVLRPFGSNKVHEVRLAPFRGAELISRVKSTSPAPPCQLIVDAITRALLSKAQLTRWAQAAGCTDVVLPAEVFPRPHGAKPHTARHTLLRALSASTATWPRVARPGADVRYVSRAFPLSARCSFYSEGPRLRFLTKGRGPPALRVTLPPGFKLHKALAASGAQTAPLQSRKACGPLCFTLPPPSAQRSRWIGVSATSKGQRRVLAIMPFSERCASANSKPKLRVGHQLKQSRAAQR
ncbi:MAG: carboxypeptidase regulatory-like domain-containing protein [Deltaproteobacteria bacterium]|nr:carboxypeptidase regulatory-like domain-containing protein [Deltaproteobacteria bacterium]